MSFDMQMMQHPNRLPPAYIAQDARDPASFGFRTSGLAVMVVVMEMAGVVVEEPSPQFPSWPPMDVPPERLELLQRALSWEHGPHPSPLDKNEQEFVKRCRATQATPSKRPGKVPAFKFRTNDGWWVKPEECRAIATSLRAFAKALDDKKMARLEATYAEAQGRLLTAVPPGEVVIQGHPNLGLSLEQLRAWVLQWASYNEAAADYGGYSVQ